VSQLKLPGSFPITGQAKWAPDVVDPVTHLKDQVSHIVTGSQNGAAAIWTAISGTQMETLAGDFGGIEPAGFSGEGNRVLTFSATIRTGSVSGMSRRAANSPCSRATWVAATRTAPPTWRSGSAPTERSS